MLVTMGPGMGARGQVVASDAYPRVVSAADLEMIKRRAVEEGLPYQTLHKYASGSALTGKKAS